MLLPLRIFISSFPLFIVAGVGTPNRLNQLFERGAIKKDGCKVIVLDVLYRDKKSANILENKQTGSELARLLYEHVLPSCIAHNAKIALYWHWSRRAIWVLYVCGPVASPPAARRKRFSLFYPLKELVFAVIGRASLHSVSRISYPTDLSCSFAILWFENHLVEPGKIFPTFNAPCTLPIPRYNKNEEVK